MNSINKYIMKTINNKHFKNIFYSKSKTLNRKYDISLLVDSIVLILQNGLSYRGFIKIIKCFNNNNIPHYSTIYNFFNKLIKYNIINITFNNLVNKYINKNKSNKFIIDSTIISNKLGMDNIGFNIYFSKHKVSKLSLITDIKGIPINVILSKGNIHDAKIIINQLDNLIKETNIKQNNNNIFIGDKAYDSNNITNKLKELNLGYLIVPKNKRNRVEPKKY